MPARNLYVLRYLCRQSHSIDAMYRRSIEHSKEARLHNLRTSRVRLLNARSAISVVPSHSCHLSLSLSFFRLSPSLLSSLSTMIHASHGIRIGIGFTGAEGTSEVNSRIHVKREMTRTKCQTVAGMDMACRVVACAQLARVRDRTNHARTRNLDDKEHSASHTASRFPPRKPGETIKNLAEYSPTYELP